MEHENVVESNRKISIVDGYDKAGKTTLIRRLSSELNIPSFKVPPPSEVHAPYSNIALNNINLLYELFSQTNVSLIIDRLIASQYAYSKVFKRELCYELRKLFLLDKKFNELGAINIYVYCSDDCELKRRLVDEDKISYNDTRLLEKLFDEYFYKLTSCRTIFCDTKYSVEDCVKKVLDEL